MKSSSWITSIRAAAAVLSIALVIAVVFIISRSDTSPPVSPLPTSLLPTPSLPVETETPVPTDTAEPEPTGTLPLPTPTSLKYYDRETLTAYYDQYYTITATSFADLPDCVCVYDVELRNAVGVVASQTIGSGIVPFVSQYQDTPPYTLAGPVSWAWGERYDEPLDEWVRMRWICDGLPDLYGYFMNADGGLMERDMRGFSYNRTLSGDDGD